MKRYIIALLIMVSATAAAARTVYSLNDNWQFFYKLETSSDYARHISLPHMLLPRLGRMFFSVTGTSRMPFCQ